MVHTFHYIIYIQVLFGIFLSITIGADDLAWKKSAPQNLFYTNELLWNMREANDIVQRLPTSAHIYLSRFSLGVHNHNVRGDISIFPVSLATAFVFPWVMIEVGGDHIDTLPNTLNDVSLIPRGYILFGNIYKNSFYLKLGYDCLPFGQEVTSFNTVPSSLKNPYMLGTIAYASPFFTSRLHGSFSGVLSNKEPGYAGIINIGLDQKRTIPLGKYLFLKPFQVGGTVGIDGIPEKLEYLLHCYASIGIMNLGDLRFTYTKRSTLSHLKTSILHNIPDILYFEWSKQFSRNKRIIPSVLVAYEDRKERAKKISASYLSLALKLEERQGGIMLVAGPRWDFLYSRMTAFFEARVTV